jgi:hypothetical protein
MTLAVGIRRVYAAGHRREYSQVFEGGVLLIHAKFLS